MLMPRRKKIFYFIAFITPALALFMFFFIIPFVQGIMVSFTNWDGITQKAPISMTKAEFEESILNKIEKPEDREFVLSIYDLDENAGMYSRLSVTGWDRFKLERIVKKTGYEPARYKSVGFQNYVNMFDSKKDTTFTPRFYTKYLFRASASLPKEISKKDFANNLTKRIEDSEEKAQVESSYRFENGVYILNENLDEDMLIDSLLDEYGLDEDEMYDIIDELEDAGLAKEEVAIPALINGLTGIEELSEAERNELNSRVETLFKIYELKSVMAENMYERVFVMGVIGFTIFFAFFNVLGANLVALLLALALDTKMKSKNVLRSIFFLPNVLSLVIVASIWKFIFVRVLPHVTGIQVWLSDPKLAPWLLVIVSVWQSCGYLMIIYLAGLQSVPEDILEAASIDGASAVKKFFNVKLPLLLPAMTISLFYSIANSLKSFDIIFALQGSTSYATDTTPVVLDIYLEAFVKNNQGYATAKAVVLCLLIIVVSGIQLTIMKRREVQQ